MPYVVLVRGDAEVASWPFPAGPSPDLSVVDRLARLQVAARRAGCSVRLRDAPSQLRELIDLAGLSGIVTDAAGPTTTEPAGPAGEPDDNRTATTEPAGPAGEPDDNRTATTEPAGPAGEPDDDRTATTEPAGPAGEPDDNRTATTEPAGPAGELDDDGTATRGPG
jgi:hypothetical protein